MSVSFDNYYWEDENITDISAYGKLIPADSISDRFVDGLNTVCLGSTRQMVFGRIPKLDRRRCDPTDPSCTSNVTLPQYTRMANLYTDDVLCDNCFIQMLYARVTSPFLADSDQSDFLVSQLQDIGDVCNVTIPDITVRALPSYVQAPPVTSINFEATTTSTTSAPATTTTCAGQLIASGSGCATLSTKYGVTTGDLQKLSGSDTCAITISTCFLAACTLQTVPTGATCDSFAASLCDSLTAGQYVCISAPGVIGTYTLAAPPLGTGADTANQQRGGPGGRVTPCPTYTSAPSATSAAGPTQTGIVSNCNSYAMADLSIGCFDFATQNCINTTQLWAWNGVLGKNGENCQTLFWAKEYYCVNTFAVSSTTPTTTSSTSKVTSTSTHNGILSNCNKCATPLNGIGCFDFATQQGITQAQLYAWNPALGLNGANCGTVFWA
ncbi:hypothetical protein BKA65DRAFT_568274 [Rhexocercosporidium sp. MPI-PUGE-AT-0058]|nr:hypothetical protein BKA65DRAFT_568274 [Rhexocercosporidium sp. MPI-PUGE-AT-0058]